MTQIICTTHYLSNALDNATYIMEVYTQQDNKLLKEVGPFPKKWVYNKYSKIIWQANQTILIFKNQDILYEKSSATNEIMWWLGFASKWSRSKQGGQGVK